MTFICISSGHERLPSDRSMVPGLRCQNSNPVCEILGNVPISFKSRLPHLNNETCNRISLTAAVQTEPEHGKGFLRRPAEKSSSQTWSHDSTSSSLLVQKRGGGLSSSPPSLPLFRPLQGSRDTGTVRWKSDMCTLLPLTVFTVSMSCLTERCHINATQR